MTFDEFIAKWNGKGIDFDGAYGDQCMDLMHQYVTEVLGQTDTRILAAPAAKDVFLGFDSVVGNQYFDKIVNTPTGVPQKGDIVLWGTDIGQYGHVAVFISGNTNNFQSFDQNWNGHQFCETITHTYKGVLGWLHPKDSTKTVQVESATFEQLVGKSTKYDSFAAAGYSDVQAVFDKINQLNGVVSDKDGDIQKLTADIQTAKQQAQDALTTAQKAHDEDLNAIGVGLDAQKERDALKTQLGAIRNELKIAPDADTTAIIDAIDALQKPQEQVIQDTKNEMKYKRLDKMVEGFVDWLRVSYQIWRKKRQ